MSRTRGRRQRSQRAGAVLLGVEHEYRVIDAAQERVAARPLVRARGGAHGRRVDPGDANAFRLPSGAVLTADGDELEMASPLLLVDASLGLTLAAATYDGTTRLADIASPYRIEGYSTHLSASTPAIRGGGAGQVEATARRVLATVGPVLAVLAEPRDAAGTLVRPRSRRIEWCGEFVDGDDLVAAAVVFAAAVVAAGDRSSSRAMAALELALDVAPSVHRYGWFLDPDTPSGHWYRDGRDAVVRRRDGRRVRLGDHLVDAWAVLRPHALRHVGGELAGLVDDRVSGRTPLPCERREPVRAPEPADEPARFEFRDVLGPHRFGDVSLECLSVTWTAAIFAACDGRRSTLVTVPTPDLHEFLDRCAAGDVLPALLARPRRVRASVDADVPRAQRRVDPASLVPRERLPDGSMPPRSPGSGRSSKDRSGEEPQPSGTMRAAPLGRRRGPWIAAAVAGLVVLGVGGAVVLGGGNTGGGSGAPAAVDGSTAVDSSVGADPTLAASTTVTVAGPPQSVTYQGTATFSSFASGIDSLSPDWQQVYIPLEGPQGLYPPPVGESAPITVTLVGPCDGVGACRASLLLSDMALGSAIFKFSFLIDDFPTIVFDLEPDGSGGYRYSRSMPWSEAAAVGNFSPCRAGDPIHRLDLVFTPDGDQLTGEISASVDPLYLAGSSGGGCWGIAYNLDVTGQAA